MKRIPEPEYMDMQDEADAYADADFNDVNAAFVNDLLAFVGDRDQARIIDMGTGPGDIPQRILSARPQWHVIGVDASLAMLLRASDGRKRRSDEVIPGYVQCDVKWLPFAAATFCVVISNSILHHVTGVESFWREIKRIGKPGAALFLRDLARPTSEAEAADLVATRAGTESALLQEEFYRSLLAAYTPEEVRGQLDKAGICGMQVMQVSDRHLDVKGRLP